MRLRLLFVLFVLFVSLKSQANNIYVSNFDELIFANDSCYGPFYPLKPIFEKMEKQNKYDFWGLTKNTFGIVQEHGIGIACKAPHLQSYFLVFSKKVFSDSGFLDFIKSIKHETSKEAIIINYEVGLTNFLTGRGFRYGVYIKGYSHTENCLAAKWDRLIKFKHFPFLKTSIPRNGLFVEGEVKNWDKVIKKNAPNYPINYIKDNACRYTNFQENLYKKMNFYRKIRYKILKNSPVEIRKIVIYIEKNGFKYLNTLCFNKLQKF